MPPPALPLPHEANWYFSVAWLGGGALLVLMLTVASCCSRGWRRKVGPATRAVEVQPADLRAAAVRAARGAGATSSSTAAPTPTMTVVEAFYDDEDPDPMSEEPEWEANWDSSERG